MGKFIRTGFAMLTMMVGLGMAHVQADTLRQVLVDAYRNSQLLEQNRFLLRTNDENVTQAISQLFPVINFTASASRDLMNDTLTNTASLVGQLVLYQGQQRRNAITAARETAAAARQQLVALEQQILLDAVVAYLSVWRDMQVVRVNEANVRVINQQLRAARDRFDVGEDTRTDVAQAEAQLAEARSGQAAAQGALEISRELFGLAVGRSPSALSGPGAMPTLPANQAEAERLARETHPAIRAIQHQVTAAEAAVAQARGQAAPTITLGAQAAETFEHPSGPAFEGSSNTLSLTFTQPIYQGGQIASLERQAIAQVAATRSGLNQQALINLQTVGNAYAQLRIAQAQIAASDQRIRAAELALEGVTEEAALGARTTLDVLDSEQDLLDARIGRIQAQADVFIAAYSVLAASGLLTVSHLGLPVPEYDANAYAGAFDAGRPRVLSPRGERLDSVLSRIGRE